MSDYFNRQGIRSASVHSDSDMRRNEALSLLEQGGLQVIFSVDLFNEGVDLPAIDTVLMLRPTESKIIFLQQLGRGLRNSSGTGKDKIGGSGFHRQPRQLLQKARSAIQRWRDN